MAIQSLWRKWERVVTFLILRPIIIHHLAVDTFEILLGRRWGKMFARWVSPGRRHEELDFGPHDFALSRAEGKVKRSTKMVMCHCRCQPITPRGCVIFLFNGTFSCIWFKKVFQCYLICNCGFHLLTDPRIIFFSFQKVMVWMWF